jgi:hypothetical protein
MKKADLAAETEHYENVVALLMGGASFDLKFDYFAQRSLSFDTHGLGPQQRSGGMNSVPGGRAHQLNPSRYAPMPSFLLNMRLLFQLKDLRTEGLETKNELIAKEKLIRAIVPALSTEAQAACWNSLGLDYQLRARTLQMLTPEGAREAYQTHCQILSDAVNQLQPYDFLWLSVGSTEHAINVVVQRNLRGDLELSVINSGEGSEYHQSNEIGQICPKTYRFHPPQGVDCRLDRQCYEREIISALGNIYTHKYEKGVLSIKNLYDTLDRIADYQRPTNDAGEQAPAYTRIVYKSGPPIDHQMADNCATMAMLGAVSLLFQEVDGCADFVAQYENALIKEMQTINPNLNSAQLSRIEQVALEKTIRTGYYKKPVC